MKHPFWILNSTLFILALVVFGFIYFSQVEVPEREDIEPDRLAKVKKEKEIQINISKIYENDLFDTFQRTRRPFEQPDYTIPLPPPPTPTSLKVPEIPTPQFLDPLGVTLKGIIVINGNTSKNRAIIEDNQTKKEQVYRVGDSIQDAQLIRILSNKIMFLRSNGQQEVLYLREQDAKADPAYSIIDGWGEVIRKIAETEYEINTQAFLDRVKNLAQFIDLLDLTTAYKQGKSVGTRIGLIEEKSLGRILGMQPGDLVLTVNGIPATTTKNRLEIYNQVRGMDYEDKITLRIRRKNIEKDFTYILKDFETQKSTGKTATPQIKRLQEEEKINILKQKHKFAPTLDEIRRRDRRKMLNREARSS